MIRGKFRSRSEHSLDVKGRLNIPSRFRDALREYGSDVLMLAPMGDHIRAYPLEVWDEVESRLLDEGSRAGHSKIVNFIVGGAEECPLDKQGRILLKPNLRKNGSALGKDVMLTGLIRWFEIQDKAACEASLSATQACLESGLENLSKLGIF